MTSLDTRLLGPQNSAFAALKLMFYIPSDVEHVAGGRRYIITSDLVQTTATLSPFPADSSHASGTCRDSTLKRDDFRD